MMKRGGGYFLMDKMEAERVAYMFVREKYGNLPSLGTPTYKEGIWVVPIDVKYPRILFEPSVDRPKKVRFMKFQNVGRIIIDEKAGTIVDKPRYYDLRNEIRDRLESIQINVQKALVKVGANRFSQLPLSEHIHSPIEDIIAYLLVNDTLNLSEALSTLSREEQGKYSKYVDALTAVGSVRRNENMLVPDNALIEIEQKGNDLSSKLSGALSYFFSEGYDNIQSIQQVLGPYLIISGDIYEKSIEYGELTEVGYAEILRTLQRYYRPAVKQFRLPRYLIQLITVGLIEQKTAAGENLWIPNQELLEEVESQSEILSPIRDMFMEKMTYV